MFWIIPDYCGYSKPVWLNIVPSDHFPAYWGEPVHHCPGYRGATEQHAEHDSSGPQQQCDHYQEHHILQRANKNAVPAKPDRPLWVQHQITARPLLGNICRPGTPSHGNHSLFHIIREFAGIHSWLGVRSDHVWRNVPVHSFRERGLHTVRNWDI